MRLSLAALLALSACSSSGPDVDVGGLWKTQVSVTTICRVFCDDGLTLETFSDAACSDWERFDGRLSCFPYHVDGDQLVIGDPPSDTVLVSDSGARLSWSKSDGTYVYDRLGDSHPVCEQRCYRGGNADEPLR